MGPRNTACHIETPSYRDPPEPTGDEPEDFEYEAPKIYEPVSIKTSLNPRWKREYSTTFLHTRGILTA